MDTIDFSDEDVKEQFSKFLMYWILKQGLTVQSVSSKSGFCDKTILRYLPGRQRNLPKFIRLDTFNILLKTIGKTYEDFHSYYSRNLTHGVDDNIGKVLKDRLVVLERVTCDGDVAPSANDIHCDIESPLRVLWVDDVPMNNSSIIASMKERGISVK